MHGGKGGYVPLLLDGNVFEREAVIRKSCRFIVARMTMVILGFERVNNINIYGCFAVTYDLKRQKIIAPVILQSQAIIF